MVVFCFNFNSIPLHHWQHMNAHPVVSPYIHSGYRSFTLTPTQCLRSIVGWHNETLNIWTHLCASLCACWCVITAPSRQNVYACLAIGFASSVCYHVLSANASLYKTALAFDVTGMYCMIYACVSTTMEQLENQCSGNFIVHALIHSYFYIVCVSWLFTMYVILVIGVIRSVSVTAPVAISFTYWIMPWIVMISNDPQCAQIVGKKWCIEYISWCGAFLVWQSQLPERWFKHPFIDNVWNSHVIWHVWVMCNTVLHMHYLEQYSLH